MNNKKISLFHSLKQDQNVLDKVNLYKKLSTYICKNKYKISLLRFFFMKNNMTSSHFTKFNFLHRFALELFLFLTTSFQYASN